jgi:hypothetical protein
MSAEGAPLEGFPDIAGYLCWPRSPSARSPGRARPASPRSNASPTPWKNGPYPRVDRLVRQHRPRRRRLPPRSRQAIGCAHMLAAGGGWGHRPAPYRCTPRAV